MAGIGDTLTNTWNQISQMYDNLVHSRPLQGMADQIGNGKIPHGPAGGGGLTIPGSGSSWVGNNGIFAPGGIFGPKQDSTQLQQAVDEYMKQQRKPAPSQGKKSRRPTPAIPVPPADLHDVFKGVISNL